jgi:hypothetical protein
MALDMGSKSDAACQFLKFSKQRQLAHVAYNEVASLNLLRFDLLLDDCTYDRLKQHFPKHVHRL